MLTTRKLFAAVTAVIMVLSSLTCVFCAETAVSGVEIKNEDTELYINERLNLSAQVTPPDADDKSVRWTSDNTECVTVTEATGVAVAVGEGTATITVSTTDGGFTDTCVITVIPAESEPDIDTTAELDEHEVKIGVNQYYRFSFIFTPSMPENTELIWSTTDTDIATVSASGLLRGRGEGTCTVKVTSSDGAFYDECEVTIVETPVDVQSVLPFITVPKGGTFSFGAYIQPADATNKIYKVNTDAPDIVSVSKDLTVTALKEGTAVITLTTDDKDKTCSLVVVVTPSDRPDPDPEQPKVVLTGIKVTTQPHIKTYTEGDLTDTSGMEVTAYYSDGTSNVITDYTVTPGHILTKYDNVLVVSYKGFCENVYIYVADNTKLESITIDAKPEKTTYLASERFQPDGIKVTAHYSDGTAIDVTDDVTYSPDGRLTADDTFVTVTLKAGLISKSVRLPVTVRETSGNTDTTDLVIFIVIVGAVIGTIITVFIIANRRRKNYFTKDDDDDYGA